MPSHGTVKTKYGRSLDGRAALDQSYWRVVEDLFTHDVSGKDIVDFLRREPRDAFRFFAREVDLESLRRKPLLKRLPLTVWRVYLAAAHRLSPPRRVLFALAVPLLIVSWARVVFSGALLSGGLFSLHLWILSAATLLFLLLILELKDRITLKSDLEIARQIQFGLLPHGTFEHKGLLIRTTMRPANTVGGDYFDLIERDADRLVLVVGDVAGKGMPAALLMGLLQGSLKTLITAELSGVALVEKLNAYLCAQIPSCRMITLFFGEFRESENELRYVNAGHNPPFVLRSDGTQERLTATGMALGLFTEARFEEMVTPLEAGDRLLLFTDGIVEAVNAKDVEYGDDRLSAFLERHRESDPQAIVEGLIDDVLAFCGEARPNDDMTILYAARRLVRQDT